eukprot:CAMPEP_0206180058 /NCGR_PEP_ID=MMETSP1474-20131121/67622_1 /ASSEMBLY_ACC=CAM_ASM_001110 /TAXON_ID=97495 /ORGANISM="Imantonia sp., Strain RCC918" /LENGTH=47 /DNA_ID= /DNA_START= /DNA_END= /DNA_ORIENTATION=
MTGCRPLGPRHHAATCSAKLGSALPTTPPTAPTQASRAPCPAASHGS